MNAGDMLHPTPHLFQFDGYVLDRLVAFFGILGQTTPDNPLQVVSCAGNRVGDRRGLFANNLIERIDRVIAFEGFASRDRLVKNAAEREDVRAMVDFVDLTLRLLWRHVTDRAHYRARRGWLRHDRGGYFAAP